MTMSSDDDVVVHGDAERLGDIDDRLGHADVGLRGRRIAGRVIVDQDWSLSIYLIINGVWLLRPCKGALTGDGESCSSVTIPMTHDWSRTELFAHAPITDRASKCCVGTLRR